MSVVSPNKLALVSIDGSIQECIALRSGECGSDALPGEYGTFMWWNGGEVGIMARSHARELNACLGNIGI